MKSRYATSVLRRATLVASALLFFTLPTLAVQPPEVQDEPIPPTPAVRSEQRFAVAPSLELLEKGSARSNGFFDLQGFFSQHSDAWDVRWDRRNDRPNLIQGVGIAVVPGSGNDLANPTARSEKAGAVSLEEISEKLRSFMTENQNLLRVDHLDLRLDRERSSSYGSDDFFWNVEFQQFHQDVPVTDAYVYFRLNHGNIVQFGAHRVADIELDATPALSKAAAFDRVQAIAGAAENTLRHESDRGAVRIYPMMSQGEAAGQEFAGVPGFGYQHLLVWELFYRSDDVPYKAVIDAESGDVLEIEDLRVYAEEGIGCEGSPSTKTVTGEIFPTSSLEDPVSVGLPYLEVFTDSGTCTTDGRGRYPYPGGSVTSFLSGTFFDVFDDCGDIELSSDDGDLDFGGASGSNCNTPQEGGAGNTNAARSTYYHLNKIRNTAATFLPKDNWLRSNVLAQTNLYRESHDPGLRCNAFWDPLDGSWGFLSADSRCLNAGELESIIIHEWGHGMDQNAGGNAFERASGEATGDTFAFLETGDSCIGRHFFKNRSCNNCRDSCTGARDLDAFALEGESTIASPSTVASDTGLNCDRFRTPTNTDNCPFYIYNRRGQPVSAYQGPMGYQGHCESLIASTANLDLTRSLQAEHGGTEGLQIMNDLWYGSLTPAGSAYRLASGGTCNPNASVDGCGHDNWFTLYLALDDDDGDLSNGTPNGCRIWDAFNAHGIACGNRPACSEPPVARFTPDSCSSLTCPFDASASSDDDGIVSYSWSFGDGNSGSGVQIDHTYASRGDYSVTLTVTDTDEQTDSETRMIEVRDPPDAKFSHQCPGLTCAFDASASSDAGGIVSYVWSFGDGATGSGRQVSHTYTSPGDYNVTLTVTDTDGESDSESRMIVVGDPPDAEFSYLCPGLTCAFDASASSDAGGIVSYAWSFGDGATGSGRQVSHTYASPGSYSVTLTVTDTDGETDSEMRTVPVDPPCTVTSFNVQSFGSGLPIVSWSATCQNPETISFQVKTSTLSLLPPECRLSEALWDGNKDGSRTADYMAGGYGPTSSCPAVELAEFWVDLVDHNDQVIDTTERQQATYNPPPLPCDLTFFSVTNRSAGLLPIVSWNTTCPNPGPVSVQVRTTTLSQDLPLECQLDDALWDANKNGSRTVDFMAGGYGNDCPHVDEASFWVELWQGDQLIRRSSFWTAEYTP